MKRILSSLSLGSVLWSVPVFAQTASAQADGNAEASADAATTGSSAASPPSQRSAPVSDQARELGQRGLRAYGLSEFATALEHFQRAERLAHSPVFELYAARCLVALDRLPEARALLQRIAAEVLTAGAPEAWRRAQAEARTELVLLDPPPNAEEASADTPDGFDPDGHVTQVASGTARMPTWHPEPTPVRNFWQRATPNQRGGLVAFGVGTTGLVFAVVTGALAFVESAKVKENCIGTSCRPEDLPRAQNAEQLANLATVGATVFITGATTGAVLWLLPSKKVTDELSIGLSGSGLSVRARF